MTDKLRHTVRGFGIPIRTLRPVFAAVQRAGVNPISLLEELGVERAISLQLNNRISREAYLEFWRRAANVTDGLAAIDAIEVANNPMIFEMVVYDPSYIMIAAFATSEDVGMGLARATRCLPAVYEGFQLRHHRLPGELVLELCAIVDSPVPPSVYEFALGLLTVAVRQCTGANVTPSDVCLAHRVSVDRYARYEATFGVPVRFGSHTNTLSYRDEDLAEPLLYDRPEIAETAVRYADEILGRESVEVPFAELVGESIRSCMTQYPPTAERVARILNLSSRTVARRLADEGTTFAKVSDGVRSELARILLLERPELSIDKIAIFLQYSDTRAFRRAFKRWFEVSPVQFRSTRRAATDR